jgi:asparagine synthase (glutamine-hydrolysing)
MAAFALWDEERQQLFLGRDRFGIKPLYYAEHAGRLYFASEIKAILADPTFPRRVNLYALQAMLTLGFVPGPATMFEGIYKLPPAHFLIARDGAFRVERYWQLDYQPNEGISEREAVEQFWELLQEAVSLRLMTEVPLGALLSGGLDSGTVVALIQRLLPGSANLGQVTGNHKLKTVSISFEQPDYDEGALARHLADFIDTEHHPLTFTPEAFAEYPAVMNHLEEPQCSATALPIYSLYRACHQAGLTVVLTGEGADELLGGYHWHQGDRLMRPLLALPKPLRQVIAASPLSISAAARRVLERANGDTAGRYQSWLEVDGEVYRRQLFSPETHAVVNHNGGNPLLLGWAEKLLNLQPSTAPFNQLLWLESRTRLADFINFEVDKMSMAHSIEARVPFLDHKLWEFCAGLPVGYKLKGRTEKYLLRQATKPLLPEAVRTRRKKGLAAPYALWLRSDRLPDWAETALTPQSLRRAGLFKVETVQALRQAHQAGRPGLGSLLMGVLSTQVWFEQFI